MSSTEAPPPFEQMNIVNLVSVDDSKIINVSLYSGRAEVTRSYKFSVRTGQNQVVISGLPNVVDRESLRVEGRGAATIHDVALSDIPPAVIPSTSAALEDLLSEKMIVQKSLDRTKKAIFSLESYLLSLKVKHIGITEVANIMDGYEESGQKLDAKSMELEKKLVEIDKCIEGERRRFSGPAENSKLMLRATIGVFADAGGEVEIVLIYAVHQATWKAAYDIRVDMQTKDKPVTLIYKAGIMQNTGEAWDDVPLTLETASPTFGLSIPSLSPWTVTVFDTPPPIKTAPGSSFPNRRHSVKKHIGLRSAMLTDGIYPGSNFHALEEESMPEMDHRILPVSSIGGVSATFQVPGAITIPSDGATHNVTIVQLNLEASMSWVTVPKADAKAHLKAKIQNASDYTLLQGPASVYVDGSFISRSDVPLVSPSESFDCPLGLDPTIRVTYHPQTKKVSHSGFYSKTSTHVFSQRITIFNTKTTAITNLKVMDQVPVSQTSTLVVKLVTPSLSVPEPSSLLPNTSGSEEMRAPPAVKVSEGVVAQWEGADPDEQGSDLQHLGRDGKFHWLCTVPPQGKVNLLLSWELAAPLRSHIIGL